MPTSPGGHAAVRDPANVQSESAGTTPPSAPGGSPAAAAASSDESHRHDTRPPPMSEPNVHVQAALAASTRAGASLSALFRAIQQATTGASGAREANEELARALETVREMLAISDEKRIALEGRVTLLAEERDRAVLSLERVKDDMQRERAFWMSEQDRFLKGMLDEHEEALQKVTRERDEARSRLEDGSNQKLPSAASRAITPPAFAARSAATQSEATLGRELAEANQTLRKLMLERERAREVLRRLQTQRDEAQEAVERLTLERDQARADLGGQHNGQESLAQTDRPDRLIPPSTQNAPSSRPLAEPTPLVGRNVSARRTDPMGPPILDHFGFAASHSPPPPELRAAITDSRPPLSTRPLAPLVLAEPDLDRLPSARYTGPLKQKPDPTAVPLGSYAVGSDEIEPERIETQRNSKPPQR